MMDPIPDTVHTMMARLIHVSMTAAEGSGCAAALTGTGPGCSGISGGNTHFLPRSDPVRFGGNHHDFRVGGRDALLPHSRGLTASRVRDAGPCALSSLPSPRWDLSTDAPRAEPCCDQVWLCVA